MTEYQDRVDRAERTLAELRARVARIGRTLPRPPASTAGAPARRTAPKTADQLAIEQRLLRGVCREEFDAIAHRVPR